MLDLSLTDEELEANAEFATEVDGTVQETGAAVSEVTVDADAQSVAQETIAIDEKAFPTE